MYQNQLRYYRTFTTVKAFKLFGLPSSELAAELWLIEIFLKQ